MPKLTQNESNHSIDRGAFLETLVALKKKNTFESALNTKLQEKLYGEKFLWMFVNK